MDKQASSSRKSSEARALPNSEHRGLDAAALACLGDLTVLAARACDAQFALISLSVGGVCRVVSKTGWSTHDQDPFGGYVMRSSSDVFVVADALVDDRFTQGMPAAAIAKHKVRFYAGVAVRDSAGRALGTFGVMDNKQRELTSAQSEALQALARQASSQLELCRGLQELSDNIAEIKKVQAEVFAADRLTLVGRLASCIAHEVNNPLACVVSNLSFAATEVSRISSPRSREIIQALEEASQGAERIRLTIQALRRLSHGNEESISDFQIRYTLAGPSRED
jgi:GAF domain-containing protein